MAGSDRIVNHLWRKRDMNWLLNLAYDTPWVVREAEWQAALIRTIVWSSALVIGAGLIAAAIYFSRKTKPD